MNSLYKLTKADIKPACEVAAKAFVGAGDYSNFSDDTEKRIEFLAKILKIIFLYCYNYGETYATSKNLEGVAAWLPHDKVEIPRWRYILSGMLQLLIRVGKEGRKELFAFDKITSEKHNEHANFPHWYLYELAVNPNHQGKGYASVLLNPMLLKADKEKLPCYVEAGERNVSLYEHFGFEVIERISVPTLNDDLWIMMRFPK